MAGRMLGGVEGGVSTRVDIVNLGTATNFLECGGFGLESQEINLKVDCVDLFVSLCVCPCKGGCICPGQSGKTSGPRPVKIHKCTNGEH